MKLCRNLHSDEYNRTNVCLAMCGGLPGWGAMSLFVGYFFDFFFLGNTPAKSQNLLSFAMLFSLVCHVSYLGTFLLH